MRELYADSTADQCHEHWHEYVTEKFSNDFWTVDEGLLLLADLWPVGAEISDAEVNHIRYGLLEPPVVCKAGLLNQECNIHLYENYERLLVLAGKRLSEIQKKWSASCHGESKFPPAFFVEWANKKGYTPCWLDLWKRQHEQQIANLSHPADWYPNKGEKWEDHHLTRLWAASLEPGATHASLANELGLSRQRISALLKIAKEKNKPTRKIASPFDPISAPKPK